MPDAGMHVDDEDGNSNDVSVLQSAEYDLEIRKLGREQVLNLEIKNLDQVQLELNGK